MRETQYLAILATAIIAFVVSMVYYIIFANARKKLNSAATDIKRPQPVKLSIEIIRNILLAFVLCYLIAQVGVTNWMGGASLGFRLWIGFPLILLSGSVMWENVPWKLASIHAGDWLIKLLLMCIILSIWR